MINCIIVDDEPHAIEVLDHYVKQTPHLQSGGKFYKSDRSLAVIGSAEDRSCFSRYTNA